MNKRSFVNACVVEIRGHRGIMILCDTDMQGSISATYVHNEITLMSETYPHDVYTFKEVKPDEICFGV